MGFLDIIDTILDFFDDNEVTTEEVTTPSSYPLPRDIRCPQCGQYTLFSVYDCSTNYTLCKKCGLSTKDLVNIVDKYIKLGQIDNAINRYSVYEKLPIVHYRQNPSVENERRSTVCRLIGRALVDQQSDYDMAMKYIEKSLYYCETSCNSMYEMYRIYKHKGCVKKARACVLNAYKWVEKDQTISSERDKANVENLYQNEFNIINKKYSEEFLNLPYHERKLLWIVDSFRNLNQEYFATLKIDTNLSNISFPVGHPKVNQMYVAHPLLTNRYLPIENYQFELIKERVREFCQLAQCLGATEINIECLNSNHNDSSNSGNQNLYGGVSRGGNSIHGSKHDEYSRRLIEEISQSISLHQTFQPHKAPAIPNNLLWYEGEPSWQRLYRQRVEGGLLTHEERIETKKSQIVDNREMKEIKGELKSLFANMDVAFDKTEEAKFEQQENAVLAISVKFAPLSQLTGNTTSMPNGSMFSTNELKYLDEVKECLADGEITRTGRRLLNMHRERLGISESRAAELEASVTAPQLTDEEKEYLEAYQEANENGQISDKERRTLNRLRDALGISEERAKEIEK